jgi:MATE family multidrug resistance protein
VRVGRALGADDPEGISRAGWTALGVGIAFMTAMAVLMWLIPSQLIGLFLDSDAEGGRVMALGISFLLVAAAFQIADGAQVIAAGMLRGLHDTRVPMIFALFGYWVVGLGTGVWLAFERDWQGVGIWTGLAVGLALVSVLLIGRWVGRARFRLVPDHRAAAPS